jgi:hypothetical protein
MTQPTSSEQLKLNFYGVYKLYDNISSTIFKEIHFIVSLA